MAMPPPRRSTRQDATMGPPAARAVDSDEPALPSGQLPDFAPPSWAEPVSMSDSELWTIEVLSQGQIVHSQSVSDSKRTFFTFGRIPLRAAGIQGTRGEESHLAIANPSLSRLHAALVFGKGGLFATDLNSKAGTRLNKRSLRAGEFARIAPGSVLQLGQSSRLVVINGPETEAESSQKLSSDGQRPTTVRVRSSTSVPVGRAKSAASSGITAAELPSVTEEGAASLRAMMLALIGSGGSVSRSDGESLKELNTALTKQRLAQEALADAELRGESKLTKKHTAAAAEAGSRASALLATLSAKLGMPLPASSTGGDAALLGGDAMETITSANHSSVSAGSTETDSTGDIFRSVDLDAMGSDSRRGRRQAGGNTADNDSDDDSGPRGLRVSRPAVSRITPAIRAASSAGAALPALLRGSTGGSARRRVGSVHVGRKRGRNAAVTTEGVMTEASLGAQLVELSKKIRDIAEHRVRTETDLLKATKDAASLPGIEASMANVTAQEAKVTLTSLNARSARLKDEKQDLMRLYTVASDKQWQDPSIAAALEPAAAAALEPAAAVLEPAAAVLIAAETEPEAASGLRMPSESQVEDGNTSLVGVHDDSSSKRSKLQADEHPPADTIGQQDAASRALAKLRQIAKIRRLQAARDASADDSGESDPALRKRAV